MSVVSGENLVPPVFNNPITTNLVNIPITSVSLTTPVVYTTPTLQQGSTYLIIVNVLVSDYNSYIMEGLILGATAGDVYTIAGNNFQLYTFNPPSTYIVAENTTFQSILPISPPSTQTYSINLEAIQSLIPSPNTPSINGTGSFIQILQLS
jgi:hypothetical protein|nr:MAG: hypothetical protein [Lake Baikal virophage 10]